MIMLVRVKSVEVGEAIDAEDHRFAIDDEVLLSVLQRGLGNPRIALASIRAVAREQPHALVLPDD